MSNYRLTELRPGAPQTLTEELASFIVYFDVNVSQANGQLNIPGGYFAALVSRPRPPRFSTPDWTSYNYRVEGADGLGNFTIGNAQLQERRQVEFINEHTCLYYAEFDTTQPVAAWFDDAGWQAGFSHPLFREGTDPSRYLFHDLSLGDADGRWAHAVGGRVTPAGTDSLTCVSPFLKPSLTRTLCSKATAPNQPGYMPRLLVRTSHGRTAPASVQWDHFNGYSAALPGAASGFVMLAQGAFKAIPFNELGSWRTPVGNGWSAVQIADRLHALVGRYPAFRRNLEAVGEHASSSVVTPPADNLPVEVLHLSGLARPLPRCG